MKEKKIVIHCIGYSGDSIACKKNKRYDGLARRVNRDIFEDLPYKMKCKKCQKTRWARFI